MIRSVVITGASAGVGRAVAQAYARRGDRVALLARGEAGLAAAEQECRRLGAEDVLAIRCDVSDPDAVFAAADRAVDAFGGVDVWVNNAMVSVFAPTWEITADEFRRVTEVNYLGTVHGSLAALRHMRPRGSGTIVQVGSALAYRGIPLQSAYCATKHAIQGFVDSLRSELLHDCPGVRVTMVQLPAMNTPQFSWVKSRLPREPQPVPPIYQPEVGARAVYWAAHNERRELYVGWPTLKAIFGDKVAPGFADWYLSKAGYDAQQTDEPISPARRDNLWEPVPGDHGARGQFDERASDSSTQLWATTHRGLFALAGVGALIGAAAAKLLLHAREQRLTDTQLERFREGGVM